ncbi:MFS transporter [Novosphingobium terrae]|uniref:MFS transporter n=1 Tax=Novosphingobium terrae TaxID=2726189 RepID=UPI00197CB93E|nr:MFS transporter [Novosphingobium terrae]
MLPPLIPPAPKPLRLSPPSTLMVYALAHAGKTLFWTVSDLYFTWMVITVGGVAAGWAGLGIGLSILIAAGADYTGGRWLGARVSDIAMAARTQFLACLATSAALLAFAILGLMRPEGLALAMMAGLILFRLTYAGLDITQNALPALIATSERERAAYGMWRNISGGLARIALSAAFVPLLMHRLRQDQALNFLAMALVIAVLACAAAALLRLRLTHGATPATVPPPAPSAAEDKPRLGPLSLAMALASLGMTLFQQLEPFFAATALDRDAATAFLTAGAVGMVGSQPLWRLLALSRHRRWTHASVIAACLACAGLMLLTNAYGLVWALVSGLFYGLAGGGVTLLLWMAALDCLPQQAIGRISTFSASAKLGQALSIALGCAMLQIGAPAPLLGMVMAAALGLVGLSILIARTGPARLHKA